MHPNRSDGTIRSMGRTVLIVDDHRGFRAQARVLLEAAGYEVAGEAEDGLSGVRAASELQPHVVLLDVQLPDISGIEVGRDESIDAHPGLGLGRRIDTDDEVAALLQFGRDQPASATEIEHPARRPAGEHLQHDAMAPVRRVLPGVCRRPTGKVRGAESDPGKAVRPGIRWYEIRGVSGTPKLFQQGTFAPDTDSRFDASVAMDRFGDLAAGYTISGRPRRNLGRTANANATSNAAINHPS